MGLNYVLKRKKNRNLRAVAYLRGGGQGANCPLTGLTGKISSIHRVGKGKIKERRRKRKGEKGKAEE